MVELLGHYSKISDWGNLRKAVTMNAASGGTRLDPLPLPVVRRPSPEERMELATAYLGWDASAADGSSVWVVEDCSDQVLASSGSGASSEGGMAEAR